MLRKLALAGAMALAFLPSIASATVTINDSPGGKLAEFMDKYQALRDTGENVEFDGDCQSACTLVLGIVPRERLCVGPRAVFGFHSASWIDASYSRPGTLFMRSIYPPDVLRALRRHGWNVASPHPQMIPISGKELRSIVRPCR